MRVYRISPDSRFSPLVLEDEEAGPLVLDGAPRYDDWQSLAFRPKHPDLAEPDVWWIDGTAAIAMNVEKENVSSEILAGMAEFLPITVGGDEFSLLNIWVLDCLDERSSDVLEGRYEFIPHRLLPILFRVPATRHREVYCWEVDEYSVLTLVTEQGWVGLEFTEVWSL